MKIKCEHCGAVLEPIELSIMCGTYTVGYRECTCPESVREREETEKLERERKLKLTMEHRLIRSNIPERYWKSLEVVDKNLLVELSEIAFKDGLYLYGGTGTGKTTMACSIAIQALMENLYVRFISAYQIPDLFKTLRNAEAAIENPDLLIIDDLGADMTNEWSNTRIRAAIDTRYNSMKPTIITSNYSKSQLTKQLTKGTDDMTPRAILSRLSEMTKTYQMDGEDLRK